MDLGFCKTGAAKDLTFELSNRTGGTIRVQRVRSTCSCFEAVDPPSELPANQPIALRVKFKAPAEPVTYDRKLYVYTDDPDQPKLALRIKARVGLPLEVAAAELDGGAMIAGECRLLAADVENSDDEPLRVVYATSSDAAVTARIPRQAVVPPGGSLSVPVVIRAGSAAGPRRATVSLHTNCPAQPVLPVAVRYRVDGGYSLRDGQIDAGRLTAGRKAEAQAVVTAEMDIEGDWIESARADVAGGQCDVRVQYAGKTAEISCTIAAGQQPGPIIGRIILHLRGREQAVEVPLHGEVVAEESVPAARDSGKE